MSHEQPALEVFTDPWAVAWGEALRSSEAYKRAAASWEGAIVLQVEAEPTANLSTARSVFLDLQHGDCRAARRADEQDLATAPFLIRADLATWRRVLAGEIEPVWGLMSGKLKLERGKMSKLLPHINASKELVAAARRLPSTFP